MDPLSSEDFDLRAAATCLTMQCEAAAETAGASRHMADDRNWGVVRMKRIELVERKSEFRVVESKIEQVVRMNGIEQVVRMNGIEQIVRMNGIEQAASMPEYYPLVLAELTLSIFVTDH